MNRLKRAVRHYLSLRRGLGYKLADASGLLTEFVAFLQAQGADYITIPLALQLAQCKSNRPAEWAHRLTCIRGFARYWSAFDRKTQIPPYSLLPYRPSRACPYLYSEKQVSELLEAAQQIGGLPGLTYHCLLGLLSVTGLRMGEVLNLKTKDVDLDRGVLVIVGAKFGKTRLVPIHASTQKALTKYVRKRDRAFGENLSVLLCLAPRPPSGWGTGPPHVLPPLQENRDQRPHRQPRAAFARLSPPLRRRNFGALVSFRTGR